MADYYMMYRGAIGALEDLRGGENTDAWLDNAWDNDMRTGYETTVKMVREILANQTPKEDTRRCKIVSYNVVACKPITHRIPAIKAIRLVTDLGLREAKTLADNVQYKAGVLVNFHSEEVAFELAAKLLRLGEGVQVEQVDCDVNHQ